MRFFTPALIILLLPLHALTAPIQEPTFEDANLDGPLTDRGLAPPAALPKATTSLLQAIGIHHKPKHHSPKPKEPAQVVVPLSSGMRFGSGPGK